ncbi:MAG TPA: PrsW family intramembrane metalloprotease [Pyrinomonadaceae bacterium]|nr:PrsW family intramembrane metalloprotease [Pyrinomonadaceae bacterium]
MDQFTAPPYPRVADAPAFPRGRRRVLRWAAALLASGLALLSGLLTLWMIGYETGVVPFLAGLVIAVLPVPVYLTLVLWLDRYESEPAWLLATSFCWGALVAVFFAIVVNSLGVLVVEGAFGTGAGNFYGMVISAPLVEEAAKALALFGLFLWRREEFDGVLDGIVYAAMVGLGFAMTENVKYYGEAVVEQNAFGVFVVRGLFSPFAHPLFTSMTGIGLGLAAHARGRAARLVLPALGLAGAVALHAAWNASAFFAGATENGLIMVASYFVVMVPAFLALLAVVLFALRREGRILREQLRADCERGLFTHEEYLRLCSLRARAGASLGALTRRGVAAWRERRRLHRAASELAFQRHRLSRGVAARDGRDAQREAEYLRQIYELTRKQ